MAGDIKVEYVEYTPEDFIDNEVDPDDSMGPVPDEDAKYDPERDNNIF